jgi:TnpA family transposase
MSTDDHGAFGPSRSSRTPRVVLPIEPSVEELARDWTLSTADLTEVRRCRGDDNRRRFAVQLCTVRRYGRFLDAYTHVPLTILTHLNRQLALAPVLFLTETEREATESEHQERIRQYLGHHAFDARRHQQLVRWLEGRVLESVLPRDLLQQAEQQLRAWRVVLPAVSTLERIVASVSAQAHHEVFVRIAEDFPPALCQQLDALLQVLPDDARSTLLHLKEYPPAASAGVVLTYLTRHQLVRDIVAGQIDLRQHNPELIHHLALMTKRYDVQALRRFAATKRHALLACFLVETEKTLLDQVIALHDQFLTTMSRRSRHAFEEQHRQLRRRAKEGVDLVLRAMDILLAPEYHSEDLRPTIYRRLGIQRLHDAVSVCREFQRLEERGYLDELCARYPILRRYLPTFLLLPFAAAPGSEALLTAIAVQRQLDTGTLAALPIDAPCGFIPPAWQGALYKEVGALDQRLWTIGLSFAVRDALRSGDLYLATSRHHVSFWNLVYHEERWHEERQDAYVTLALPTAADTALARLQQEYTDAVTHADQGLATNPFATIRAEELHLKRADALEIPEQTKQLRRVIENSLPRIRIEDLLQEVDTPCGFTREFRPLSGYDPHVPNLYATQLAAVIAHGTNLGIAAMGQSTEGITVDMLQHVTRFFLTDATVKAANATLVNFHHQLPFSAVWGSGDTSSSDGQRFGLQASSLLGSFYPRYFGYYERAFTIYSHLSNQFSVFSTQVISCSPREALYVLDGLLQNDTLLRPREHYTDTHGFTEQLFALCYLLGYSFMPRLRDLADQQLYRATSDVSVGQLQPLFHGTADVALIREQWDQLVRVAASLRNRSAPAHVVLQRLTTASPSDRVAKALTALGRIIKTIFILRYIHEDPLRRRIQLQLNRGEARHEVARWLFFANRGEFRTGDYEEIMNKASCLSLLSNAVVVWNTVAMEKIVAQLRANGQDVQDTHLARVSPLLHQHIIPNGTYRFPSSRVGG